MMCNSLFSFQCLPMSVTSCSSQLDIERMWLSWLVSLTASVRLRLSYRVCAFQPTQTETAQRNPNTFVTYNACQKIYGSYSQIHMGILIIWVILTNIYGYTNYMGHTHWNYYGSEIAKSGTDEGYLAEMSAIYINHQHLPVFTQKRIIVGTLASIT